MLSVILAVARAVIAPSRSKVNVDMVFDNLNKAFDYVRPIGPRPIPFNLWGRSCRLIEGLAHYKLTQYRER